MGRIKKVAVGFGIGEFTAVFVRAKNADILLNKDFPPFEEIDKFKQKHADWLKIYFADTKTAVFTRPWDAFRFYYVDLQSNEMRFIPEDVVRRYTEIGEKWLCLSGTKIKYLLFLDHDSKTFKLCHSDPVEGLKILIDLVEKLDKIDRSVRARIPVVPLIGAQYTQNGTEIICNYVAKEPVQLKNDDKADIGMIKVCYKYGDIPRVYMFPQNQKAKAYEEISLEEFEELIK